MLHQSGVQAHLLESPFNSLSSADLALNANPHETLGGEFIESRLQGFGKVNIMSCEYVL